MKITLLLCLIMLVIRPAQGQSVLFEQNFSAGAPLSQYENTSSPNTGQFNNIQGLSAAIVNNTLQFDRSNGTGTAHYTRSTSIAPVLNSLYVQMDFEVVSQTAAAASSALVFYVGSGFESNTTNAPLVPNMYARFGINTTDIGGQFSVRYINSNQNLSEDFGLFSGKQTITFILNNTGFRVTYLQPGGGLQTVENDRFDLWVGTMQAFNEYPTQNPNQTMENFKLRIDAGLNRGIYQFDNFLIRDISGALPLSTTDFRAVTSGPHVKLSWQATNQSASLFTLERSSDAQEFVAVGQVRASKEQTHYTFRDESPVAGTNYYRLRQTNANGSVLMSKIVAVEAVANVPGFTVLDNPGAASAIVVQTESLLDAIFQLTTLTGQQISYQQCKTPDGQVTLLLQHPLPSGVYLLTASTETAKVTRRVQVR